MVCICYENLVIVCNLLCLFECYFIQTLLLFIVPLSMCFYSVVYLYIGPDVSASYIFKTTDGSGSWTQYQRIVSPINGNDGLPLLNLSTPTLNSGTLAFGGTENAMLMTQFHETSCFRIYLSDQFLDGWDIAVLTVRAPDTTEDRFQPHCDQVPLYEFYDFCHDVVP